MTILIAGASGLIGSALTEEMSGAGDRVLRLVRRPAATPDEIAWDPAAGQLDPARLEGVDAVVNLSGENVGAGRWTAARRERIRRSRVDATRTLVVALAGLPRKPAVFVSASAVGFYGDGGDEVLTESSAPGHGFLPEVCLAWETHAEGAARHGIRTVVTRFGVVLASHGGALAKMLPLFRRGLGGRLGGGRQWMSWVSLRDVVGAVRHVIATPAMTGPVNVVAPGAVTNAEFTARLAAQVRRPAVLAVPGWALRLAVGRGLADEALLASARAVPQRLEAAGYTFRQPTLAAALPCIL